MGSEMCIRDRHTANRTVEHLINSTPVLEKAQKKKKRVLNAYLIRERERERHRDRQTDRHRQTERWGGGQTDRKRAETETESGTWTWRNKERNRRTYDRESVY